ncbi:MAG: DUF6498-containing protein, partial [Cytophagaceae bacterium]
FKFMLILKYLLIYSFLLFVAFIPIYQVFSEGPSLKYADSNVVLDIMISQHLLNPGVQLILLSFILGYGFSFYRHYWLKRKYLEAKLMHQMNPLSHRISLILIFFYLCIVYYMIFFNLNYVVILFVILKVLLDLKDRDGEYYIRFYMYK